MSDRPLFQNTDAQEAAYDPQGHGADETGGRMNEDVGEAVIIPAGGLGMGGGGMAGGVGSAAGTGVGPAIGAVALNEAAEDDEEGQRRRDR